MLYVGVIIPAVVRQTRRQTSKRPIKRKAFLMFGTVMANDAQAGDTFTPDIKCDIAEVICRNSYSTAAQGRGIMHRSKYPTDLAFTCALLTACTCQCMTTNC